MKRFLLLVPIIGGLLCAVPRLARAQDTIAGSWAAENVGFSPWIFHLAADGSKLTGTVSQGAGAGPIGSGLFAPTEIRDGAIEGSRISFTVLSPNGGDRKISFKGVVAGNTLTFDRSVELRAGGDPGGNGIYGTAGAKRFTARRVDDAEAASLRAAAMAGVTDTAGSLHVVMLGTGTPNPDPDRSGPAVAILAGSQAYLVDAGPGVVRRAAAAEEKTQDQALRVTALTHVFLTHLHSDHTLGYPDLIFTPAVVGRTGPLNVFGPKGTKEMTDHLMAAWKKDIDVRVNGLEHESAEPYKVNVHEISPGVVYQDANVMVRAFLVPHATWDQAFGYRFDAAGRSIVISGDTRPSASVVEACHGCDVLVHEVYCDPTSGPAGAYYQSAHTSASELARIATQAKPKLLVLYHQLFHGCAETTLLDQVQRKYSGAVVSAKDFDIF